MYWEDREFYLDKEHCWQMFHADVSHHGMIHLPWYSPEFMHKEDAYEVMEQMIANDEQLSIELALSEYHEYRKSLTEQPTYEIPAWKILSDMLTELLKETK